MYIVLFQAKKFRAFYSDILCIHFGDLKVYFRNKPLKIQKNTFCNLIFEYVLDFKSNWKKVKLWKNLKIDFPYCTGLVLLVIVIIPTVLVG
jgi:hypothetical protein